MKHSIDEVLEEARQFFLDRAQIAKSPEAKAVNEHLRALSEVIQENTRMLDVLRHELDELRHVVGVR